MIDFQIYLICVRTRHGPVAGCLLARDQKEALAKAIKLVKARFKRQARVELVHRFIAGEFCGPVPNLDFLSRFDRLNLVPVFGADDLDCLTAQAVKLCQQVEAFCIKGE